uniref:Uncharacterized protein n=2 Tax=Nothobranchius korthausae TaxID=1143690 RepID=A0A1A8HIL5_9TELE
MNMIQQKPSCKVSFVHVGSNKDSRVCLVWSNFICRTSRKTHSERVPSHLDNETLSTAEKSSELADIHVEIKREREKREKICPCGL